MRKSQLNELIQESSVSDNIVNKDDYIIETATPLSLSSNRINNETIVTLIWLCKAKSERIFTLGSSYFTDSEIEDEIIKELPFHNDNIFISSKISSNITMSALPNYICNMEFYTDDIYDCKEFKLDAVIVGNSKEKYTFTVSNELFASFSFIDNYICDCIINNYEVTLAIIAAAKVPEFETELFVIDKIDSVVSLTPTDKKSSSVGVIFQVSKEKEIATILAPFDVGIRLPRSKFKGNTIKKIEETYLRDSDQYISVFIMNTRIKNLDKEFLIIKAKNKNNKNKLFFLSANVRKQLEDMVKEF